jgi:uncharacterized membrane protein YhaH (DUF805 family)
LTNASNLNGTTSEAVPLSKPVLGASPIDAFVRFWKKYATFSGRASRSEYWWWYLIGFVVNAILSGLSRVDGPAGNIFSVLASVWGLAIVIPTLALLWRRLHDTNRSGLWAFAPIVFSVAGAVLLLTGAFTLSSAAPGQTGIASVAGLQFVIAFVLFGIGAVITVILTLLPSNPAGERFDS